MAHDHRSNVVERDSSYSGVVFAILAIVLIMFLVWAVFFSGWVIDRDTGDGGTTRIEREQEQTDVDVNVPSEGEQEQPQPATSP